MLQIRTPQVKELANALTPWYSEFRKMVTPKAQKNKIEPSSKSSDKKKIIKKLKTPTPLKLKNSNIQMRPRTATVPNVETPKRNNIPTPQPCTSVKKSTKKPAWKRKPKPAHSGVPVPEKMKRLGAALFKDLD